MSQTSLSVNSNVTIKVLNQDGNVTRIARIHNKASVQMVEGLLRFLCGDFNQTKYNSYSSSVLNSEADGYVPSEVRFGTIGVLLEDRSSDKPKLKAIDTSRLKTPTFDEFRLQQEIKSEVITDGAPVVNFQADTFSFKFDSVDITSFDDPNNSMGLLIQKFIPAGKLVGRRNGEGGRDYFIDGFVYGKDGEKLESGEGWTYFNPSTNEYEAMFTELGLYSGTGTLLARVLFDGTFTVNEDGYIEFEDDLYENNPIVQSDTSSIVVEWRIGIVSIGQNDHIISGKDLTDLGKKSGKSIVLDDLVQESESM